jgi:hypothetical protein
VLTFLASRSITFLLLPLARSSQFPPPGVLCLFVQVDSWYSLVCIVWTSKNSIFEFRSSHSVFFLPVFELGMAPRKSDLASSYEDVGASESYLSAREDLRPTRRRVSESRHQAQSSSFSSTEFTDLDVKAESSIESLRLVRGNNSADSSSTVGDTAGDEEALASQLAGVRAGGNRTPRTPTKTRSRNKSPTPSSRTPKRKRRLPGSIRLPSLEQSESSGSQNDSDLASKPITSNRRPQSLSLLNSVLGVVKWILELLFAPISSALSNFVLIALLALAAYAVILYSIPSSFYGIAKTVTFFPSSVTPFISVTRHVGGAGRWAWCRTVGWRCSVDDTRKARMVRRVYDSASAANDIFSRSVTHLWQMCSGMLCSNLRSVIALGDPTSLGLHHVECAFCFIESPTRNLYFDG